MPDLLNLDEIQEPVLNLDEIDSGKKKEETEVSPLQSLELPSTSESSTTSVDQKIFQEPQLAEGGVVDTGEDTQKTLDILEFDKGIEKMSPKQKELFGRVRTKLGEEGLKTPQEHIYLYQKGIESGKQPIEAALYADLTPVTKDGKISYEIPIESTSKFQKEAEFEYKKMLQEKKPDTPFMRQLNDQLIAGAGDFVSQTMDVLGFAGLNLIEGYDELTQKQYDAVENIASNMPQEQQSIIEMAQSGDVGGASGKAALSLARTIPSMITMMAGGQVGLLNMSAGVARAKYRELKDSDVPELMKVVSSISDGVAEFVFEGAITLPMMNQAKKAFVKLGREQAEKTLKPAFTNELERVVSGVWGFTNPAIKEGASEAATQIIQNMGDVAYLGQDKDIMEGVSDAFVVGALMGKGITGPVDIANLSGYLKGKVKKIPEGVSMAKKYVVTPLLVKKDQILKNKEKADDAFAPQFKEEINAVDEEIRSEVEKPEVEEQDADMQNIPVDSGLDTELDALIKEEEKASRKELEAKKNEELAAKRTPKTEPTISGTSKTKAIDYIGETAIDKEGREGTITVASNGQILFETEDRIVELGSAGEAETSIMEDYGINLKTETKPRDISIKGKPAIDETKEVSNEELQQKTEQELKDIESYEQEFVDEYEKERLAKAEKQTKELEYMTINHNGKDYMVRKKKDGSYSIMNDQMKAERSKEVRSAVEAKYETERPKAEEKILTEAVSDIEQAKKESSDRILDALNWLVDITELKRDKLYSNPLAIPQSMLNASFKIVRATYTAGKDLAKAINEGIKYLESRGQKVDRVKYIKHFKEQVNAQKDGTSTEETVQKEKHVQEKVQRTGVRDNEKDGMEAKDEKKVRRTFKEKRAEKEKALNKLKEEFKAKNIPPEDAKKELRKFFNEVRKITKPYRNVGESRTVSYASAIKKIDDNAESIIKKMEDDIDAGITLDKVLNDFMRQVERTEKTTLRQMIDKQLGIKTSNKVAQQTMRSTKSALKEIDNIRNEREKTRTKEIDELTEEYMSNNSKLSKAQAKRQATKDVDQRIENDVQKEAASFIEGYILRVGRKSVQNTDFMREVLEVYTSGTLDDMANILDEVNIFTKEGIQKLKEYKEGIASKKRELSEKITANKSSIITDFLSSFTPDRRKKGVGFASLMRRAATMKGSQGNFFKNLIEKILAVQAVTSTSMYGKNVLKTIETIHSLLSENQKDSPLDAFLVKVSSAEAKRNRLTVDTLHDFFENAAKAMGIKVDKSNPFKAQKEIKQKLASLQKEKVNVTLSEDGGETYTSTEISRGALWNLYLMTQNEGVLNKMMTNGQINKVTLAEIEQLMSPEEIGLANAILSVTTEIGNKLEKFSIENNIPYTMEENYFPTKVDRYEKSELKETDAGTRLPQVGNEGFFQQRTEHSNRFSVEDRNAMDVFVKYVHDTARSLSNKEAVDEANAVLGNKYVTETLKAFNLYNTYANRLATALGYNYSSETKQPWVGYLSGTVAKSTLAFKPMQIIKQATSALAGVEGYSELLRGKNDFIVINKFTKDVGYAMLHYKKIYNEMLEKSPEFKMRMENWYRANIDASVSVSPEQIHGKILNSLENMGAKGMLPTKWGDAAGILLGYYPIYRQAKRNGMSEKQALSLFEKYDRTQQAALKAHRTEWQDNNMAKVFTMWQSTTIAYMNKVDQAKVELWKEFKRTGKINKRQVYKILLYRQILNGLFTVVGNIPTLIFGGDDEDKLFGMELKEKQKSFVSALIRSQIIGNLNAVPLMGDIANSVYNLASGEKFRHGGSPLMATYDKFNREFEKVAGETISESFGSKKQTRGGRRRTEPINEFEMASDVVAMGIDAMTGAGLYNAKRVAYDGLFKMGESIIEGDEKETKTAVANFLALPKSQIEQEKKRGR